MRPVLVPGHFKYMATGGSVKRGHGDATGRSAIWHLPEIGLWKVMPECLRIEDNLGDHAIGPLVIEQGEDLLLRLFLIVMGVSDGDKA